jgi:hypothetical protein
VLVLFSPFIIFTGWFFALLYSHQRLCHLLTVQCNTSVSSWYFCHHSKYKQEIYSKWCAEHRRTLGSKITFCHNLNKVSTAEKEVHTSVILTASSATLTSISGRKQRRKQQKMVSMRRVNRTSSRFCRNCRATLLGFGPIALPTQVNTSFIFISTLYVRFSICFLLVNYRYVACPPAQSVKLTTHKLSSSMVKK